MKYSKVKGLFPFPDNEYQIKLYNRDLELLLSMTDMVSPGWKMDVHLQPSLLL